MFEYILLGTIQGIAEWLPVSSEGLILLAKTNILHSQDPLSSTISQALFLHFGTFLAAFVYFFKDVLFLTKALFHYPQQTSQTKKTINFLALTTLISGLLGISLLLLFTTFVSQFEATGKTLTLIIGFLLLGTAALELKNKQAGQKNLNDLNYKEGVLLGLIQGCAALPGLSRSGLTVSALLLRKFEKKHALKLSFLMSLPLVLGGNIILHANAFSWSLAHFYGLLSSFLFGLATIHILLKITEKINFGFFMLGFGLLTIAASFI